MAGEPMSERFRLCNKFIFDGLDNAPKPPQAYAK
jgi:hypothetical protein